MGAPRVIIFLLARVLSGCSGGRIAIGDYRGGAGPLRAGFYTAPSRPDPGADDNAQEEAPLRQCGVAEEYLHLFCVSDNAASKPDCPRVPGTASEAQTIEDQVQRLRYHAGIGRTAWGRHLASVRNLHGRASAGSRVKVRCFLFAFGTIFALFL